MISLTQLLLVLGGVIAIVLIVRSMATKLKAGGERVAALEQLGFEPCPDRTGWLEATIAGIEHDPLTQYAVQDARRSPGEPTIYWYVKRHAPSPRHHDAFAVEEVLFPLKRSSTAGLVLMVKPSSLAPGLVAGALAAIESLETHPDDLRRLEMPPDLKDSNVVKAYGPPGASLYDLVGSSVLDAAQSLGDAGGIFVRCRDAWCTVGASSSAPTPFRVEQIVAAIRPLL